MKALTLKTTSILKDLAISAVMLGLLLAFTKLVKFVVLLIQEVGELSEQFSYEKETIERTSRYIVNTPTGRRWATSFELNSQAENLSNQIQSGQMMFVVLIILVLFAFVILYFSLDFLIEYTRKFKPWSIIFLLVTFISTVFYMEFIDLRETGNGFCFMFTTIISIITGIILVGYTLLFPNYMKVED